jgi:hypothetical protein
MYNEGNDDPLGDRDGLLWTALVAERVDSERGQALPAEVPTMPGESRGTDLSESLASLVLRLWQEVEGPAGRE